MKAMWVTLSIVAAILAGAWIVSDSIQKTSRAEQRTVEHSVKYRYHRIGKRCDFDLQCRLQEGDAYRETLK